MDPLQLHPIGTVRCLARYPYEVPRQAALADNEAVIELQDDERLRQGLHDLAGFERLWVISWFPGNTRWRALVQPPDQDADRHGVFATRSPHRPNPIGLSCVRLIGIDGLHLTIRDHDLLDGTPVLDLKPYLPYADAFPEALAGWTEQRHQNVYQLQFSDLARAQADWIRDHAKLDIHGFIQAQLRTDPIDTDRKRVSPEADGWCIAYRTWRLHFTLTGDRLQIERIRSGYTPAQLADAEEDRYGDKAHHREFIGRWP